MNDVIIFLDDETPPHIVDEVVRVFFAKSA